MWHIPFRYYLHPSSVTEAPTAYWAVSKTTDEHKVNMKPATFTVTVMNGEPLIRYGEVAPERAAKIAGSISASQVMKKLNLNQRGGQAATL